MHKTAIGLLCFALPLLALRAGAQPAAAEPLLPTSPDAPLIETATDAERGGLDRGAFLIVEPEAYFQQLDKTAIQSYGARAELALGKSGTALVLGGAALSSRNSDQNTELSGYALRGGLKYYFVEQVSLQLVGFYAPQSGTRSGAVDWGYHDPFFVLSPLNYNLDVDAVTYGADLDLKLRLTPAEDVFAPYFILGAGLAQPDVSGSGRLSAMWSGKLQTWDAGAYARFQSDAAFSLRVALGADFNLTKPVGLFVEGAFQETYLGQSFQIAGREIEATSQWANTWALRGGLRIYIY